MRVLLCLCVFVSVTCAGFIRYPYSSYYGSYSYPNVVSHPVTTYTIARPLGSFYGFHGYPLAFQPSYYNVLPYSFYSGFPGVITYWPVAADGKKKDKKKPGDKKDDKKEETTEESKKEDEGSKGEEEDLTE